MSNAFPPDHYEGLGTRLRALDALVAQLIGDLAGWFREYLDVGEYGLAVEVVAERLNSNMPLELVRPLAVGLLLEAEVMGLSEVAAHLRPLTVS